MAGFKNHDEDDTISDINVTPLVDVVLVLLIIFMVTTSAIVKAAITVDLPKAATAQAVTKPPVSILIGCKEKQDKTAGVGCTPGEVVVDGEVVLDLSVSGTNVDPLIASLRTKAEAAKVGTEEPPSVLITADKDLRFQNVIWLMDICKNLGYGAIMFNSELFTRPGDAVTVP